MPPRLPLLFLPLLVLLCTACGGGGDDDDEAADGDVVGLTYAGEIATLPPAELQQELSPGDTLRIAVQPGEVLQTNLVDGTVPLLRQGNVLRGQLEIGGTPTELELDVSDELRPLLRLQTGPGSGLSVPLELAPVLDATSTPEPDIAGRYRAAVVSSDFDDEDDDDDPFDPFPVFSGFDVVIGDHGGLVWPQIDRRMQLISAPADRLVARSSGPEVSGLVPGAEKGQVEIVLQAPDPDASIRSVLEVMVDGDDDGRLDDLVGTAVVELVPVEVLARPAGSFELVVDPTRPAPSGVFSDFERRTFVLDQDGSADFVVDGSTLASDVPVGVIDNQLVGFVPAGGSGIHQDFSFGLDADRALVGTGRLRAFDRDGTPQGEVFVTANRSPVVLAASG